MTPDEFEVTGDQERDDASVMIISFFQGLKYIHEGNLLLAETCLWLADMDGRSLEL